MEFFWEMLSLQETMFLLILTGVLIKKLKIIDAAGRKMLSDLLIDESTLGSRGAFSPTASSVPTPALWGCRWPACCLGIWA